MGSCQRTDCEEVRGPQGLVQRVLRPGHQQDQREDIRPAVQRQRHGCPERVHPDTRGDEHNKGGVPVVGRDPDREV